DQQPIFNSHTVLSLPSFVSISSPCPHTPPCSPRLHKSSPACPPPRPTRLPPTTSTSPAATPPSVVSGRRRRAASSRATSTSSQAASGFPSSPRRAHRRACRRARRRASPAPRAATGARRRGRLPATAAPFAGLRAPSAWASRRRSCRSCSARACLLICV
ncbi:hypothetical protein T484DRAFT_1901518, partial [Baffinella frigidus]